MLFDNMNVGQMPFEVSFLGELLLAEMTFKLRWFVAFESSVIVNGC